MPDSSPAGFRHALSTYNAPEEAAATAVPYLRDGFDRRETVAVHVSPAVQACLDATEVGHALKAKEELGDVVQHPHQTLWALRQLADAAGRRGSRLRVLFELDALAHDPLDWARAEAAANAVLNDSPVQALCLCDVTATHRLALAELMRAHPELWRDGAGGGNPEYVTPRNQLRVLDSRRSPDPLEAWPAKRTISLDGGVPGLAGVRSAVQPMLDAAGVSNGRQQDFLEAVFQVCVNALMHGGEKAEVRFWDTSASVLCRVRDDGEGLSDPLMGYLPPLNGLNGWSTAGTSLWAARQLCDHMTATMEPEGFTVRMTVNA
jgi:anti-sigma regulatory factor (Ser/Thr protein kinase)